jgi:Transposase DDE domain
MSQRTADFTRPVFGEQALAAFQAELCERLPLGCTGLKLNDAVVWQLLCYAATRRTTIEQAAQSLDGVPSANRVREQLRELLPVSLPELRQLEHQLNRALQAQLPQGVRARLQRQAVEVAGDLTDLPYHGEPEADAAEIRRSQAKSGTTHFHSYASLQIVHHRQRLTLALTFVQQGEKMAAVLGRLLEAARALGVRIRRAYFDKGFASVAVLRCLRARRVPYVIALPARGGAGGLKRHFRGRRHQGLCYTFGRGTRRPYPTEVVIVRREFSGGQVRYFAYAVYRLGGVRLGRVFEYYRRRFSIESGYRQCHQVRARTASRHPGLRLLLFALALLLVNLWVLYCQVCAVSGAYGGRLRLYDLRLASLALALESAVVARCGLRPIEQAMPVAKVT